MKKFDFNLQTIIKKILPAKRAKKREPLTESSVDLENGLNEAQILERQTKGYVNDFNARTSKSVLEILFVNLFNFFNVLCLGVFAWIMTVSKNFEDLKNAMFIFTVALNTGIGIFQELKAKKTMDRLSLMTSAEVRAMRKGKLEIIKFKDILLDDVILLSAGAKICSDAILTDGTIEVNESQLTGESLPVKKTVGDEILSGSFVVSGNGKCRVQKIAEENYIQQISLKAKEFKESKSELMRNIRSVMRLIGILIIPLAVLAFFNNYNAHLVAINADAKLFSSNGMFFEAMQHLDKFGPELRHEAYRQAVISTAGQLVAMLPTGMFLLVSVTLAAGVIRLSKRKAMVQDLYAIEMLARVNTICLDKTGTLTDGTMRVVHVIELSDKKDKDKDFYTVADLIGSMQAALDENNQTALALKDYFSVATAIPFEFAIPFSSERKASAVKLTDVGLCVLGAPEYVTNRLSQKLQKDIEGYQANGNRCLLLAINDSKSVADKKSIPQYSTPYALIVIEDNVKKDVERTISLFKENKVDVKIISGDNPITVSAIAKRIGVKGADKFISLQNMTDEEIKSCAANYTVFGRVNPAQKKLLVQIFKNAGQTVAMVGDGVNDILALKESDCSIAMANGSDAARDAAHIVLLNSDFSCMPSILSEGRRAIGNVERASSLFLTKTLFSFLFLVCLIFLRMSNPLEPIQITFTSFIAIGIPSFVLAMEPNNAQVEGKFLPKIAKNIIPSAVSLTIALVIVMILQSGGVLANSGILQGEYKTLLTYIVFGSFVILLHKICKPLNNTRILLLIFVVIFALICALVMPLLPNQSLNIYKLSWLNHFVSLTLLATILFCCEKLSKTTEVILHKYNEKKLAKHIV